MMTKTVKRLMFVLFLGILVLGLNAEINVVQSKKVTEGYVEFSGGKTWYRMVGEIGNGLPLIVIHGGPGVNSWYLKPLEKLANQRPVILYDQRGGGNSDPLPPEKWNVEFFIEELRQIIQQLGLKRYHIMGHSWGGAVATDFALTQPEGLISLILSSPLISTNLWVEDQRELLKKLPYSIQEVIYWHEENGIFDTPEYQEAMMVYYNLYLCRLDPWPDMLLEAFGAQNVDIYSTMWGPSEFTCTGSLRSYDRSDSLYMIEVPTLFTCGEYDEATPKTVQYYANQMPNAKLKVFMQSSHTAMLEQSTCFIKAVRRFLKTLERQNLENRKKKNNLRM